MQLSKIARDIKNYHNLPAAQYVVYDLPKGPDGFPPELSREQEDLLHYIEVYHARNSHWPTLREMAKHVHNTSLTAIAFELGLLYAWGYMRLVLVDLWPRRNGRVKCAVCGATAKIGNEVDQDSGWLFVHKSEWPKGHADETTLCGGKCLEKWARKQL